MFSVRFDCLVYSQTVRKCLSNIITLDDDDINSKRRVTVVLYLKII